MTISKRELLAPLGAAVASMIAARDATGENPSGNPKETSSEGTHAHDMMAFPPHWHGKEKIAFLAYQQFTALDLVGPHYMLGNLMGATTYIVSKSRDPIFSDMKLTFLPDTTYDDCPDDIDIICVPGGTAGTLAAMRDEATIEFLKTRGARAKYITSVCTGSLLLGAAGLLKGYKATSHWCAREVLRTFGAEAVNARVVVDRNRITGGGVTAGLDFGLTLVSLLRDSDYAKGLQLIAEYQPDPPFNSGTPEQAGPTLTGMMTEMFSSFLADARLAADDAMRRL